MKYAKLNRYAVRFVCLVSLATGVWATSINMANAVSFTPPPDNPTPSQGSGGASRN